MLSRLVIALLPRSKCLLISCLQSPFTVILEPKEIKSATIPFPPPSFCPEVMGPNWGSERASENIRMMMCTKTPGTFWS